MRGSKDAPRDPLSGLERLHGLAVIFERGAGVCGERPSVNPPIAILRPTPSPAILSPVRHKTILVSYARCGWAADNWAFMSRDVLEVYVKGIVEQESGLGHDLLRSSISVWTPASGPVQKSIP